MRKKLSGLLAAVVIALVFLPGGVGAEGKPEAEVTLTEEQKTEMAALQTQMLEQKKVILNKYVEYGVFTEEKAQKIIAHMDKHYKKLEENGFIPTWDRKHGKHHNEE
ncbi:YckD family protein [Halalkalibacter krulwichiae]|uniref:DUF2680 domain-containing protein n=1 Tax=Halalkalibacter krulwichiae TaxID=199441 RepID=A0A1X9MFN6_9BACI|nr:YckD family protein [Halalkalibacter krulwichiae]ARK32265.1 hypothetical protein BkAM31D_21740 [Halalkalibacter krulwichiae]